MYFLKEFTAIADRHEKRRKTQITAFFNMRMGNKKYTKK